MCPTPHRWFQFHLRDLFLSITFIAIGLPGTMMWFRPYDPNISVASYVLGLLVSITLIGAGIGTPFRLGFFAGIIGCIIAIAILVMVFFWALAMTG